MNRITKKAEKASWKTCLPVEHQRFINHRYLHVIRSFISPNTCNYTLIISYSKFKMIVDMNSRYLKQFKYIYKIKHSSEFHLNRCEFIFKIALWTKWMLFLSKKFHVIYMRGTIFNNFYWENNYNLLKNIPPHNQSKFHWWLSNKFD